MAYRRFVQRSPHGWSQWLEVARKTQFACCECGLVHTHHYVIEVHERTKKAAIWLRVRKHKARTAARRKQMKRYRSKGGLA